MHKTREILRQKWVLDRTHRETARSTGTSAGEKMFVDYAGKKPSIVERATGEVTEVELFAAVLGASSYT